VNDSAIIFVYFPMLVSC